SPYRRGLFDAMERLIDELTRCRCSRILLDGSFVTEKPVPGDYDLCWETKGVDYTAIDPVLMSNDRAAMKKKYFGDIFPANLDKPDVGIPGLFQIDKYTGRAKGIVSVFL